MTEKKGNAMCDSGDEGPQPKTRYLIGPVEEPDNPRALMGLEAALNTLREYFTQCDPGDEIRFRVVEMTEAEVEALPEL